VGNSIASAAEAGSAPVQLVDPTIIELSVGGPIDLATCLLHNIHMSSGLPWWATLAAATLVVRTFMFPLVIRSTKNVQRLQVIKEDIEKLSEKMKAAQNTDPSLTQHYATELRNMFKKNDCHPLRSFQMPLIQMPIFMSFFFAIQRLASDGLGGFTPEQIGMTTEGFAHITNLALPDPMYIMPVITSATMLAVIELGADGNAPMAGQMKMVMRGMSVLVLPITANMPAGLFAYWMTNNLFSLSQVAILKLPAVRDAVGLLPPEALPKPKGDAAPEVLKFASEEQMQGKRKSKKQILAEQAESLKKDAKDAPN